jgi:phage repressor protein C with HTH and peptisase S24 domain
MAKTAKAPRILSHAQIWSALDRLAERAGLSASALAKKAGLDPTTFNKSKRVTADGRERWPSTESVAKALEATNSSIDSFVHLIGDATRTVRTVPLLGFAQAEADRHFDDSGFPAGKGWDEMALPSVDDEHCFALEISGDQMRPAYRDGEVIVVSPATPIRRGDRVVVKTTGGEVMVKELKRRTAKALELQSLNPNQPDRTLAAADIAWIARIVWVSQ